MVKRSVEKAHTPAWEKELRKAIGKLDRVALHGIKSDKAIKKVCREVMNLIDGPARLVHITPTILQSLKEKSKKKWTRHHNTLPEIVLSETEVAIQAQKIRNDWDSAQWKIHAPHGWVWKEEGNKEWRWKKEKTSKQVVAVMYETKDSPGVHEIYLDKAILTHPQGALILIENIIKRHKALMRWDQQNEAWTTIQKKK